MFSKKNVLIGVSFVFIALASYSAYTGWAKQDVKLYVWQSLTKLLPENITFQLKLAYELKTSQFFTADIAQYQKVNKLKKDGYDLELDQDTLDSLSRIDQIKNIYKNIIDLDAENVEAHFELAQIFAAIGQITEAFGSYIECVKIKPTFLEAHFQLGSLYAEVGAVTDAIFAFEQMIELADKDEDVYIQVIAKLKNLSESYPQEFDYRQSHHQMLNKYVALINSLEPNAQSFFNLGSLLRETNDFERAISAYQMALDIQPKHIKTLYSLGNVYKDLGQSQKAISYYERVLAIDPKFRDAYLNLGIVYMQNENFQKAESIYKKALEFRPNDSKIQFNLGYIYEITGHYREAINNYSNSSNIDNNNPNIFYNMGNVYLELQKPSEAISSYLKVVAIDPNHQNAWVNLAITSFNEKQYQSALKYYDEAVLLGYEPKEDFRIAIDAIRSR